VTNFYSPLRQIASIWASFQLALASFDRVFEVIHMKSDITILPTKEVTKTDSIIEFRDVSFHYPDGENILNKINFSLEKGKTYALV
jgi:ATP-binding cassette subfamily B protein